MAILTVLAVLILGALCGSALAFYSCARAYQKAADAMAGWVAPKLRDANLAVCELIADLREHKPLISPQLERELSEFLCRGTEVATAEVLKDTAIIVADGIDDHTLRSVGVMNRWASAFRVECERLGLRCSGPQYRAAYVHGRRRVQDRCFALGAAPPPPPPSDDLDTTRDGSSELAS